MAAFLLCPREPYFIATSVVMMTNYFHQRSGHQQPFETFLNLRLILFYRLAFDFDQTLKWIWARVKTAKQRPLVFSLTTWCSWNTVSLLVSC